MPTNIYLSWIPPNDFLVDSYEVIWKSDTDTVGCPGVEEESVPTTITDTSYDITGLEEDSSYTITVRAINDAGSSEVSNTVTAMTLEAGERDSH